ncbi:MAG: CCA tRNA nucleotidyltransferase [Gemmatimonadaceae bacterium]|nr:CCA tRNA nucleotidyltransferase [Gemmatimonadaceae bacterium]
MRGIAEVLERAGHEVWCVGGAVRDALLGEPHLDWDLATSATPDVVRRLFRRTVPLGIEFGTVGVIDAAGVMHEVTTFRRDVETDGRHAVVVFGVSIEDDLARRDFTVNAIAVSADGTRLVDPFDGRGDLARRVVRAVGTPRERMVEDRLRALRALRFAARFGFAIDPHTWEAIVESAPHLGRLSAERVKQEIDKTLEQVAAPSGAFRRWRDAGAFATVAPAFGALDDTAWEALDRIPRAPRGATPARATKRRLERLAMMCLPLPAHDVRAQLRALRFSNADQSWILRMVAAVAAQREAVYRLVRDAESSAPRRRIARGIAHDAGRLDATTVVRLALAASPVQVDRRRAAAAWRLVRDVAAHDPVSVADLAVDGDDLRAVGIVGPALGDALRALLADVLDDVSLNTREVLMARAGARAARAGAHASS